MAHTRVQQVEAQVEALGAALSDMQQMLIKNNAAMNSFESDLGSSINKTKNHVHHQNKTNESVNSKIEAAQSAVKTTRAYHARLDQRLTQAQMASANTASSLERYIRDNELRTERRDGDFMQFNSRLEQVEHGDQPALNGRLSNVEHQLADVQNDVRMICYYFGLTLTGAQGPPPRYY